MWNVGIGGWSGFPIASMPRFIALSKVAFVYFFKAPDDARLGPILPLRSGPWQPAHVNDVVRVFPFATRSVVGLATADFGPPVTHANIVAAIKSVVAAIN